MDERQYTLDRQTDRQTGRNYGIDALRILSMLMVVTLHVLGHGGILDSTKAYSVNYEIAWFIEILALCAVNCYALISGYVGVYAKFKFSNLILLWLRVVFYSVGIAIVMKLMIPDIPLNLKGFVTLLFPVMTGKYWYFTSYFLMYLFIPILNYALKSLSQNILKLSLLAIVFLTSVVAPVANIFSDNIWWLGGGYSTFWLIILYLIGGYIRRFGALENVKKIWFCLAYLFFAFLTFGSRIVIQLVTTSLFGSIKYENLWTSYISVTILAEAVSLLLFFSRIQFKSIFRKIVVFMAPLAFSVYLIHEHPYIREQLIDNRFAWYANLNSAVMVLSIIGTAIAIFVLCILIDCLREALFNVLKAKCKLNSFESMIKNRIRRI